MARLEGASWLVWRVTRGPFGVGLVTRLEGPRGPFGVGLVARLEEEVDS